MVMGGDVMTVGEGDGDGFFIKVIHGWMSIMIWL